MWVGDFLVNAWIGVAMSELAWMNCGWKTRHLNTASSMTAIIILFVVVKEGGLETSFQVSTIVLCNIQHCLISCVASNCYIQLATQHGNDPISSPFAHVHSYISSGARSLITDMEKIQRAVENHQAYEKNLAEAKVNGFSLVLLQKKVTTSGSQVGESVIQSCRGLSQSSWTASVVSAKFKRYIMRSGIKSYRRLNDI